MVLYVCVLMISENFYFSELLQLLKFVSLLIYSVTNFRCYKNQLYGNKLPVAIVDIAKKFF